MLGTDAAQGAFVIFGQFFAFVDIATNITDKLFHIAIQPFLFFVIQTFPAQAGEAKLTDVSPSAAALICGDL